MDASDFHSLVKNFTNLTQEEYSQIRELAKLYPYSQLIHLVGSRGARDMQEKNQLELLHQTAIYSTDRSVMKLAMAIPRASRVEYVHEALKEPEREPGITHHAFMDKEVPAVEKHLPSESTLTKQKILLTDDALRSDLALELEKLRKLKHAFEQSYEDLQKTIHEDQELKASKVNPAKVPDAPAFIEEIKSTRKKLKSDSPKQREQDEIIDQFIKAAPTLPKAKPTKAVADLSEDSGSIGDNVVSETLVTILLKQGKKEKAIEMLKKLIWKFPQKKAYFAAQISELSN